MKELWARIGVSISLEDDQYNKFIELVEKGDDDSIEQAQDILWVAYEYSHELVGESYLPADYNGLEDDFEF